MDCSAEPNISSVNLHYLALMVTVLAETNIRVCSVGTNPISRLVAELKSVSRTFQFFQVRVAGLLAMRPSGFRGDWCAKGSSAISDLMSC